MNRSLLHLSKPVLDILGAGIGLLVLFLVIRMVALITRWQMGMPVFFRQTRAGLAGRQFQMIKFRTIKDTRDILGKPLPDSERLTKLGRFLRSNSLNSSPRRH